MRILKERNRCNSTEGPQATVMKQRQTIIEIHSYINSKMAQKINQCHLKSRKYNLKMWKPPKEAHIQLLSQEKNNRNTRIITPSLQSRAFQFLYTVPLLYSVCFSEWHHHLLLLPLSLRIFFLPLHLCHLQVLGVERWEHQMDLPGSHLDSDWGKSATFVAAYKCSLKIHKDTLL